MRTKIEIKNYERMKPAFIPTTPARLKDNPLVRPRVVERIPALVRNDKGRQTATTAPERTTPPLKMALFAQPGCSSSEKEAASYLALIKALSERGHRLLILERQENSKKKKEPPQCGHSIFYSSIKELKDRFTPAIRNADFVMISSD